MSGMTDQEAISGLESLHFMADRDEKDAIDHAINRLRGDGEQQAVASPANCRNRLMAEGKPYPKSGCKHCKTGGITGCPYERRVHDTRPQPVAVAGDESAAYDAWFLSQQGTAYDGAWTFARAAWMHRAGLSATPAAPATERAKVVMPEWPGEGWNPMETAPRDGTMLRLLVDFTDHATEDSDRAPTIGSNSFDNTGEDEWQFAGWSWSQDCYTQGEGTPVGWLPMLDKEHHDRSAAPAPVAGDAVAKLPDLWRDYEYSSATLPEYVANSLANELEAALAQDRASQGAAAGVPEGWRMLRPGEVIERDDQFLQGDSITWEKAPLLVIGMKYRPGVLHPARRLAAAPSAPTQGAEREVS